MIEFRVLGPIEVVERGEPVVLGRGKERSLLALLLLRANEVVATDRIVDELWPGRAPVNAVKTVQVYVSRLRQRLGGELIATRAPGYVLTVRPEQLDLMRFEELVHDAHDAPPSKAAVGLREALALFRGPVLADVAHEPFAQLEIRRLHELRLAALEARIAADLSLGRDADLVPELDALVLQHPLRERLRAHLGLALYRAGRQADALEAVREGRRTFADELGLEPAEELKQLERSILQHDPALRAPPAREEIGAVSRPRRRRWRPLVLVAAVLVVMALGAFALGSVRDGRGPLQAQPNSVALIDAATNAVTAVIPVTDRPTHLAVHADDVWVLHPDARSLTPVSRSDRKASRTIGLGGAPGGIVVDDRGVWVSDSLTATVTLIDPRQPELRRGFGTRSEPLRLAHSDAGALALGFGTVWFASGERTVTRVDPVKLVVRGAIRDIDTAGPSLGGIAVGSRAVWVAGLHGVTEVDPRFNTVAAVIPLAVFRVSGIAATQEGVWVSDVGSDQVFLVGSARQGVVKATKVGAQPLGVEYGAGAIWVANSGDGTVSRIDPAAGTVVATIEVGGNPTDVTVIGDDVWVTVG